MAIKNLANNIIHSGVSQNINPYLSRRVLFTNVIFVTLIFVYTFFIILDFDSYLGPISEWNFDVITVPIMVIYCILGIYLNRIGFSFIGRIGFLILWPSLMHILPVILLQTPPDYYLAFPLGIIFHSVLIQLFISYKREKVTFYILMLMSLAIIIYTRDFLVSNDIQPDRMNNDIVSSEYYVLVGILYWLLFNTMVFYVMKVIEELIDKNEEQRSLLIDQNTELEQMNSVVDDANKQLEKEVKARTIELEQANETLTHYSFYNAHKVKGPFCRIQGLVMLKEKGAIDNDEFNNRLKVSIDELEKAIADMQTKLNEADKRSIEE